MSYAAYIVYTYALGIVTGLCIAACISMHERSKPRPRGNYGYRPRPSGSGAPNPPPREP